MMDNFLEDVGIIERIGERRKERRRSLPDGRQLLPQRYEENADAMLMEILSGLPSSIITIAPLLTMLPHNFDIALERH